MPPSHRIRRGDTAVGWTLGDLKRPLGALGALAGLVLAAPTSMIVSCNAHELGHVLVAVPLGWEVERINWCLPGGGSIEYRHIGVWAGNAQGYAGGLVAAAFLLAVYAVAFERPRTPLRGPAWWTAGIGLGLPVGPQVIIAILEGSAGPGEDYTAVFRDDPALFVPLMAGAMILVATAYVWRWRAVVLAEAVHLSEGGP